MKTRKKQPRTERCIAQAKSLLEQSLTAVDTEEIEMLFHQFFKRQLALYRKDHGWQHRLYLETIRYRSVHDAGDLTFEDITAYLLYDTIWDAFFVEGINYPYCALPLDVWIRRAPMTPLPTKIEGELRIATSENRAGEREAA